MKRLRILHVVPSYLPAFRYGGPIYSVHGLARATHARGHDVHVFTTNVDGPAVSNVPTDRSADMDGVKVRYFRCGVGSRIYRSPDMAAALENCVRDFDILHIHSVFLWPTLIAARIAKRVGVPYILAPRGMLVSDLISKKSQIAKLAWISFFESANLSNANAVHVTSAIEELEIRTLGLAVKRFVFVPNGLDLPQQLSATFGSRSDRPYVLSLGRLSWKKGLDRLIRSFRHVEQADLVIAGNDDENYRTKLENIVAECGLTGRVRFVGPVHGDEKWTLIRSAAVFALASYSENFGNAVLEAMACGVPVVVTPEVGLALEVQAEGAGQVVSGDPKVLGRAIAALLADPAGREKLGKAGRAVAERKYSWGTVAAQMEAAYFDVLQLKSHDA